MRVSILWLDIWVDCPFKKVNSMQFWLYDDFKDIKWLINSMWHFSPIFTGKPGGRRRVMKSRSLAKWALEMAMRSMMGVTCSASERGWTSLNHSVALNLSKTHRGKETKPLFLIHMKTRFKSWHFGVAIEMVPLHFAGELIGPPNISVIQIKLCIEVLLRCDSCWVMRTSALRNLTLETQ